MTTDPKLTKRIRFLYTSVPVRQPSAVVCPPSISQTAARPLTIRRAPHECRLSLPVHCPPAAPFVRCPHAVRCPSPSSRCGVNRMFRVSHSEFRHRPPRPPSLCADSSPCDRGASSASLMAEDDSQPPRRTTDGVRGASVYEKLPAENVHRHLSCPPCPHVTCLAVGMTLLHVTLHQLWLRVTCRVLTGQLRYACCVCFTDVLAMCAAFLQAIVVMKLNACFILQDITI